MDGDDRVNEGYVSLDAYKLGRTSTMIHAELQALHRYWDSLRAGRMTPLRSDIDPRDMDCDARNLFILENLGRGNVRFRLAGTAIVNAFGMELRGLNARSIMADASRESFTALILETLEDPGVGYARLLDANDPENVWEVNLLPLRSDFGMVDRVIGCLHPVNPGRARQRTAPLRFRIDAISVESIEGARTPTAHAPVPRRDFPVQSNTGFAENAAGFDPSGRPEKTAQRRRFKTIEGGRTTQVTTSSGGRGHLRLIEE